MDTNCRRSLWLAALLLAGCNQANQAPLVRSAPEVTVGTPVEMQVEDTYYYEGYTAAVSTVDIRARVTGYLSKVYFQDGADVKEGDPLYLIDPRPYKAELDQAKAEVGTIEARLRRLDADLARAEKLLPKRAMSQEEYDKIAADRAEAAAELRAKEATEEKADLNLHFAAIKAPISGRISRTFVTEGNLVAANETLLTSIVSTNPIYAYFDVDEPTVLRVQKMILEGKVVSAREAKMKVYLGLDIDEGYPHVGYIDFIENRVDPKTGTLKIRAIFDNPKQVLAPGLHVRIKLSIGKPVTALAVSERAIGTNQGQKYVFVVNEKNEVVYRPVKLGSLQNHMRVVSEGLTAADRVIINGLQRVRPGVVVEPKTASMTAQTTKPVDTDSTAGP